MIRILLMLNILASVIYAQPVFEKVLEKNYNELPFKVRIENSGIYGISSFDLAGGNIQLNLFDEKSSIVISENRLAKKIDNSSNLGKVKNVKTFADDKQSQWKEEDGILFNDKGDEYAVKVTRNTLSLSYNNTGKLEISFPGDLGYAELIGIDKNENYFLLAEQYISEVPLKVKRSIYIVDNSGNILSLLNIPTIKYIFTVKEFHVDAEGNLFHMLTDKDKISIVKWSGLTSGSLLTVSYPEEFNKYIHYNNFLSTNEKIDRTQSSSINRPQAPASRTAALRIGDTYVNHKYICYTANLAPAGRTAADGDIVKTPAWLIEGWNARIPYKWGGFCTIPQFNTGLYKGYTAGDINTAGVSENAEGVDCSGFVSRCWQMSYHAATSGMWDIVNIYPSWDSLKPGDAILKSGHVRLFVEKTPNGALKVVEAAARNWDVSYWTFTLADQATYSPVVYKNMVSDYSFNQPELLSAVVNEGKVILSWKSDTLNVSGYRLYSSVDGLTWTKIKDESTLKETTTTLDAAKKSEYFRVSSVLNNGMQTEGLWSNVLVAGESNSAKKYLIVDGFDREGGSYRGAGHGFTIQYGKVLGSKDLSFSSMKSRELDSNNIKLYDAVYWISGDESSIDETLSSREQNVLKGYLEQGGKLFISGSEIAYDISSSSSATASDKAFFTNYLKAVYISDNAGTTTAAGTQGSYFQNINIVFGQTYTEDYPDEIIPAGGSETCFKYSNGKIAGINYTGLFGGGSVPGKLIYFAFPIETTANDSTINKIISSSLSYFNGEPNGINEEMVINSFELMQNYPNPFNPNTSIKYSVPVDGMVKVSIYNILGKEIKVLMNEFQNAGSYQISFNAANLPSGVYFYKLEAGNFSSIKKMTLIK